MDHLISARRRNLVLIYRKTVSIVWWILPCQRIIEWILTISKNKKIKKMEKWLNFVRELATLWNVNVTVIPVVIGALGMVPKRVEERRGIWNQTKNRAHSYYSIFEMGQNIEKSPGEQRRLPVTQIPVRDQQLTLMWKTRKE